MREVLKLTKKYGIIKWEAFIKNKTTFLGKMYKNYPKYLNFLDKLL